MIVPTGGDIDASLRSLRIQFNDIDGVGVQQNKSVQVERGKVLIAVRQLLELKNGRMRLGTQAADGLNPIGWKEWVLENLTITAHQAAQNVGYAVNPERMRAKRLRNNLSGKARSLRAFKLAWASYPDEMKRQVAEFVIAEVRKEQAQ